MKSDRLDWPGHDAILEEGARRYAEVAAVWQKVNETAPHELGDQHLLWLAVAQLEQCICTWNGPVPAQLALCVFLIMLYDQKMDPEHRCQCLHTPPRLNLELPPRRSN